MNPLLFQLLIVLVGASLLSYWGCAYSGRGCAGPSNGGSRGRPPCPGCFPIRLSASAPRV